MRGLREIVPERARRRGLLAGLCLILSACAPVPSARHGLVEGPAIASLNPCSDAVLAEVADPAQILAISHYSQNAASSSMDLARARRMNATSGALEELLALHPDVVIADPFLPAVTAIALERRGIRLVRMPIASTVEESKVQVMVLATVAGHRQRGEDLAARIDRALARAAPPSGSRAIAAPISAVVWQSGGIVPGDTSLIGDLLRRTGFRNLAAAKGMRQADYLPLEVMLADPPRVILAAGDPRSNEDRLLAHPALERLRGTRRERFDPSLLWCGGPTIVRAAARLAEVRKAT